MRHYSKLLVTLAAVGLMGIAVGDRSAQATGGASLFDAFGGEYTGTTAPLFPRAFYDVNVTNPNTLRDFLWVIDSTYDLLRSQGASPQRIDFVVSLRGLSVAFAANDYGVGDPATQLVGEEIRQYLDTLSTKGVRIEACQISCDWVSVNCGELHDSVIVIDNAFASSIWYQTRGYALIPIHQLPS